MMDGLIGGVVCAGATLFFIVWVHQAAKKRPPGNYRLGANCLKSPVSVGLPITTESGRCFTRSGCVVRRYPFDRVSVEPPRGD
jgi:hypothetical protein